MLLHVLRRVDQHAARADARVVDPHVLGGGEEFDHHADHGARGVELAALASGRVRELLDQVLVRGTDQVGELEVLRTQPDPPEVRDEQLEALVGQLRRPRRSA